MHNGKKYFKSKCTGSNFHSKITVSLGNLLLYHPIKANSLFQKVSPYIKVTVFAIQTLTYVFVLISVVNLHAHI